MPNGVPRRNAIDRELRYEPKMIGLAPAVFNAAIAVPRHCVDG